MSVTQLSCTLHDMKWIKDLSSGILKVHCVQGPEQMTPWSLSLQVCQNHSLAACKGHQLLPSSGGFLTWHVCPYLLLLGPSLIVSNGSCLLREVSLVSLPNQGPNSHIETLLGAGVPAFFANSHLPTLHTRRTSSALTGSSYL